MGIHVVKQNHNLQYDYHRIRDLYDRIQNRVWSVHDMSVLKSELDSKVCPPSQNSIAHYTYYERDVSNWALEIQDLDWWASNAEYCDCAEMTSDSQQKHKLKAITKKKGKKTFCKTS